MSSNLLLLLVLLVWTLLFIIVIAVFTNRARKRNRSKQRYHKPLNKGNIETQKRDYSEQYNQLLNRSNVGQDNGETRKHDHIEQYYQEQLGRSDTEQDYAEARYKGDIGEAIVAASSKQLSSAYHILKNIVLRINDGTTQIDQIIVSKFGIFVLEIKNYEGWIFGSATQKQWTQRFYTGDKFHFQNPLIQNQRHIKALHLLLKIPPAKFISVVVFVGDGELKTSDKLPDNVTTKENYLAYIQNHTVPLLTDIEVVEITNKISNNCLSDAEHQRYMDKVKQYRNYH